MTSSQYKAARRARGTREQIAPLVGVSVSGLIKRENGSSSICKQAELLILSLPKLPRPVKDRSVGRPKVCKKAKKTLCIQRKSGFN